MNLPTLLRTTALLAAAILGTAAAPAATPPAKPNILFIAIDDLRDWVHYLGHEQVRTPNLDRLAARGVTFTHSYCAAPVCNPSRTALMSGLRPSTSGVYDNGTDWRKAIPDVVTLPLHFRANGYYAAGAGKIYHEAYPRPTDWDDYHPQGATDSDDVENPGKGRGRNAQKAAGSDAAHDGVDG